MYCKTESGLIGEGEVEFFMSRTFSETASNGQDIYYN